MKHIKVELANKEYRLTPSGSKFDLNRIGVSEKGTATTTNLAYHISLSSAIDKMAKDVMSDGDEVLTLKQYVERYELALLEIKEIINEIEY